MSLSRRDDELVELMDDPACDPVALRRTIERFGLVNRLVAGWTRTYARQLAPVIAAGGGFARILDIGCGGGDVLRHLARLARRDGFTTECVGIDPDPRVLRVAESAPGVDGVSYRRATAAELAGDRERFDLVISNHVLHHLDDRVRADFFAESEALSSRLCVHSDIERGRLAFAAYAIGVTPLAPGSFLRTDGLRSIRRSYTAPELQQVVPYGWRVARAAPFRLHAIHVTDGRAG